MEEEHNLSTEEVVLSLEAGLLVFMLRYIDTAKRGSLELIVCVKQKGQQNFSAAPFV